MVFSFIHRKKNTCIHTNGITHGILIVTNSMVKQYIRVEFSCRNFLLEALIEEIQIVIL